MSALDLARIQFGVTTVYHFLFVPITIGLSFLVALMQTFWYRGGDVRWLRATKFFGKLLLINFAMGVVTGIVQEFQFGMGWSDYSRFVGDIFGAPLAVEALLAFFLESTFLGLWIFGWDRLPRSVHLATIWLASIGTLLSAYFILAANSFMQHPTGYVINPVTHRANLTDFGAVLFQNTTVVTYFHTVSSCFLVAGSFVLGISLWSLMRGKSVEVMRKTLNMGIVTVLIGGALVLVSGDTQARVMFTQQPMKMASAEALYETTSGAPFSLFTVGSVSGDSASFSIDIPGLTSFLATGDWNGTVTGVNELNAQYQQTFGPGDYRPYIPMAYWAFRFMMGFGILAMLFALIAWWVTRKGAIPSSRWLRWMAISLPLLPLLGTTFGWIFTEMGRQPWIVFGLMLTSAGVSPTLTSATVWISLITFTLLYGALAVVEVGLILRAVKIGPPEEVELLPEDDDANNGRTLTFAY